MRPPELLAPCRILTVDRAGRWTAALKTALGDFPCEFVPWQAAAPPPSASLAGWQGLCDLLLCPTKPCSLALFHCSPESLPFLPVWSEAARLRTLPPLVGLLDTHEPESVDWLREIGCAQVYAGLHTLERLVKTVKSISPPPVYLDSRLEEWIEANLPWNH